jgi:hypothetical protein
LGTLGIILLRCQILFAISSTAVGMVRTQSEQTKHGDERLWESPDSEDVGVFTGNIVGVVRVVWRSDLRSTRFARVHTSAFRDER